MKSLKSERVPGPASPGNVGDLTRDCRPTCVVLYTHALSKSLKRFYLKMKTNIFAPALVLIAAVSLASTARADIKTDQAIAKAEEQFSKGKPDEAIKSLAKLAAGTPSVEAYLA